MGITHRSRLYLLLVLSLMLGACESTTAPSGKPGFDSGAAMEAYAEMDSLKS